MTCAKPVLHPARANAASLHNAIRLLAVVLSFTLPGMQRCAAAQGGAAKIAVAYSLSGPGSSVGSPELEGVRLAVEEANATSATPAIELSVNDDRSRIDEGRKLAQRIAASNALVVLGPATTLMAMKTGPLYGEAGIAAIGASTSGDEVTVPRTFFRAIASTSDDGEMLASYLRYILGGNHAIVLYKDDDFGRASADGFRRAAKRLGLNAEFRAFATQAESEQLARAAASAPDNPAIVLAAYDQDCVAPLMALRRQGARGPILGSVTMASDTFSGYFARQPEEKQKPGFFTDGVYAVSPVMYDSGNAETLAFAARYRARFNHEPTLWSAQGYETARLAVAAVRATATGAPPETSAEVQQRREAVRAYLAGLNSPANGIAGLNGPLWFTPERGREQALRVGRFENGVFVSAPGQLVPVHNPTAAELASQAVLEIGAGRYARRQQVVYTGIFVNELPSVNVADGSFSADFYFWTRFIKDNSPDAANPEEISFPDMVRGSFDYRVPVAQSVLPDGSMYRLWQVRGDFKSDFDLHHYPFDRQSLAIRFFNARAASDRIVYVQDRRRGAWAEASAGTRAPVTAAGVAAAAAPPALAAQAAAAHPATANEPSAGHDAEVAASANFAPGAFRKITEWQVLSAGESRANLVTQSDLGDTRLQGLERVRELSGFSATVELRRSAIATVAKRLFVLVLLTSILFASLQFPPSRLSDKVTVAITASLSGAVLVSSVNSQLGNVGYVMAVEYVFYIFFALCLLSIVSMVASERLRAAQHPQIAARVDQAVNVVFVLTVLGTALVAWRVALRW
jgi:branched-chain amino acid transport system substrate-binding protein